MEIYNKSIDEINAVQKISVNPTRQSGHKPQNEHGKEQDINHDSFSAETQPVFRQYYQEAQTQRQVFKVVRETIFWFELNLLLQNPNQPFDFFAPSNREVVETELTIVPNLNPDELFYLDPNLIESDRYFFFLDFGGSNFTILDKWTTHSTQILIKPLDDEFSAPFIDAMNTVKDIKSLENIVTFMLMDGTRITIQSKKGDYFRCIDVLKNNFRCHANGSTSEDNVQHSAFFEPAIFEDGYISEATIPRGKTVFAGGKGNDWYDSSGLLIWGKAIKTNIKDPHFPILDSGYVESKLGPADYHRVEKSV